VVARDILRRIVIGELNICKDKDKRHISTNSQSLWIDLPDQCNPGLVGIMDISRLGGEKPRAGCFT
jgi:hypothetical protein